MTTDTLHGRTEIGSHEYALTSDLLACRMADDNWQIFRVTDAGTQDLGHDFKSLRACRQWVKRGAA